MAISTSLSLFPGQNNTEVRPSNNSIMASKCASERKSHMSLTLNQKLDIIKPGEEGVPQAETSEN